MTYCWYCAVNAWPAEIVEVYFDVYRRFPEVHALDIYQALHWGPGHTVWEDENFDEDCIRHHLCMIAKRDDVEYRIARVSMTLLLCISEHIRVPYSDPDYPPPPPKGPMLPIPQYDNFPADIKERFDIPYESDN